jgi:hypothetical protein
MRCNIPTRTIEEAAIQGQVRHSDTQRAPLIFLNTFRQIRKRPPTVQTEAGVLIFIKRVCRVSK